MMEKVKNGEVVFYVSKLLEGVKHGFSSRTGGVSAHEHTASLNLAFGRGDDEDTVLENLAIFCRAVGIDEKSVVSLPQIHSSNVIKVSAANRGAGYFFKDETLPEGCDGYVTRERGVALGVKTADCVPILLWDRENSVCGALHAGWRGSVCDIAGQGVRKMTELGATPASIRAAIGPCIRSCCYEVSCDVYSAALECDAMLGVYFQEKGNGKYMADLIGLNRALLIRAGLSAENIDADPPCTCCNDDIFFSHRASGGKRGTQLSVITLD